MHPSEQEVASIYALWKEVFAFDDGGSIDDYFQRNFKREHCYIVKEKDEIVATLCAHPHTLCISNTLVESLFISGVITHPKHRGQGIMKRLFKQVFQLHVVCPLWTLQAYEPSIYSSLGFEEAYPYRRYTIDQLHRDGTHISKTITPQDMHTLTTTFLKDFDGYEQRDITWYENDLLEAKAQGQTIFGIHQNQNLIGYAKLSESTAMNMIDEIVYTNEDVLQNLLAYASSLQKPVQVDLFQPLNFPFPYETKHALMVKIGNKEALKNILQKDITCVKDVYDRKPLYHYGYW